MKQGELVFLPSDRQTRRCIAAAERALLRGDADALPPAGQLLLEHMQFVKDHFLRTGYRFRFFRRLPRGEKDARILEMARECVWTDTDVLDRAAVRKALEKWSRERAFTLQECDFLETALQMALMEKAAHLAKDIKRDMDAFARAKKCFCALQRGQNAAIPRDRTGAWHLRQLAREAEDERVLSLVDHEMERRGLTGESWRQQIREGRFFQGERMRRILLSLKELDGMDLLPVKERVLPVFGALRADESFSRMDRESRWAYARRCEHLGREFGMDEAQVAACAAALGEGKTGAMGHAGWYLSEDADLIGRMAGRGRGGALLLRGEKRYRLFRLAAAAACGMFLLLFGAEWYVLAAALPVFDHLLQVVLRPVMDKIHPGPLFPRLEKECAAPDVRLLVVLPARIRTRQHFLQLARRLLVFREGCPGQADFLLYGMECHGRPDWDAEAFAALEMMNESEGRKRYFCLLDGEAKDAAQAVRRLCAWIMAPETAAPVPHGTMGTADLAQGYDYVIMLDEHVYLPPDAVDKWVRTMQHPLQKGRVAALAPQSEYAAPFGYTVFRGTGIIDPCLFDENSRCLITRDVRLYPRQRQSLTREMDEALDMARQAFWVTHGKNGHGKGQAAEKLLCALVPLAATALFLFAAGGAMPYPALFALPWPFRGMLRRLRTLPARALYALMGFAGSKKRADMKEGMFGQPASLLVSSLLCGAVLVALALSQGGFLPMAVIGVIWLCAPLWGLGKDAPSAFSEGDIRFLRQMARDTWRFFRHHVTEETHFLPPHFVQLSPRREACAYATPADAGLYLVSVLAAREMNLITGTEMGKRMDGAVAAMEKWPKVQGVPFLRYDALTLQAADDTLSSGETGVYCMALLCAAQGARAHIREMERLHRQLPVRLEKLLDDVRLDSLYDARNGRFFRYVQNGVPSRGHMDLYGGESLLLCFAAVVKGQMPHRHFASLEKVFVRSGGGAALLSMHGGLEEYLLPRLLLPYMQDTALSASAVHAVRTQMGKGQIWGAAGCACADMDAQLHYIHRPFGVRHLARRPGEERVAAPYAAALALQCMPRSALFNLRRMSRYAGEYGFPEALDDRPARLEKAPRVVDMHHAQHQGMVLCAIANALCQDVLVRHTCRVPRVESALPLLMQFTPRHVPMRREAKRPLPRRKEEDMARKAGVNGEADGWLMGFHGSCMAVNHLGQGLLRTEKMAWTPFTGAWDKDEGFRLYVRDLQEESFVRPALSGGKFFTGSVCFSMETDHLTITELRTMAPLTGAHLVQVRVKNKDRKARDADVVSFLPLDCAWDGEIMRLDERVLTVQSGEMYLGHYAVGNCASLDALGDADAFFGAGGAHAPRFVTEGQPCVDLGREAHKCMAFRMRLALGPGEEGYCAFITCACTDEQKLSDTLRSYADRKKISRAFTLARHAAHQQMDMLHMDAARQALYGRLLGACLFYHQPHQTSLPAVPAEELERYHVTGDAPLVTLLLQNGEDSVLLHHLLRFHEWLRIQGMGVDVCVVCSRETGETKPVWDCVRHAVAKAGALEYLDREKGIHLLPLRSGEERALCQLSRVVLKGGQTLLGQLDALAGRERIENHPRRLLPKPMDAPLLAADKGLGGFTEENTYVVDACGHMAYRTMLQGKTMGLLVSGCGVMESRHACFPGGRITGGAGMGCTAEEILWETDEGIYPLTHGLLETDAAVCTYRVLCGETEGKTEVFVHPEAPLSIRRVTLRSREETCGTLRFCVRFSMGEREEYTRLYRRGASVAAVHGGCMGAAYMITSAENAETEVSDVPWAQVSIPLVLKMRESVQVSMALGFAEDILKVPLAWDKDAAGALRHVKQAWQAMLEGLKVYTMEEHLDRMLNKWLPRQCLCAWMENAFSLWDGLGLLYTHPECLRAGLVRCIEESVDRDGEQLWLTPFAADLYTRVTGENMLLTDDQGQTLLDRCLAALEGMEKGGAGQAFRAVCAARALAPWCDEQTAAKLHLMEKELLKKEEEAWTGEWYRDMPGDESMSVSLQCMAALAGAPVRRVRRAMGHVWTAIYDEAEKMLTREGMQHMQDVLLAVMALCRMEEGEKAWALFYALPVFGGGAMEYDAAGQVLHVFYHHLMGFQLQKDRAALVPCRGAGEREVTLTFRFGRAVYHLTADSHTALVTLDGKRQDERHIPLSPDAGTHEARFPMWKV